MYQNTIIVVCGPTAVGKTALAIEIAKALKTQIISADSRQCFKELTIGVAKPSPEELEAVHHYFINSHSIYDTVNAGVYEKYALAAADEIFKQSRTAVMVGGTGLYIKAFTDGMDGIPAVDPDIRLQVNAAYEKNGLDYLQQQVAQKDPAFWAVGEQQNPKRLLRALEVILSTGRSITTFRTGVKQQRPFNIIKIGLEIPRQQLYDRINNRVDAMVEVGLVHEVEQLLPFKNINALQTVGYRELFEYFEHKISLDQAFADIKTNTRHYAKRQMTWFKKDEQISWYSPTNFSLERVLHLLPL